MTNVETTKFQETLHEHAFWLYGVIAGLAIEEALGSVIPHLFTRAEVSGGASQDTKLLFAAFFRLAVFLIVIIRFYVGSALFFESAHIHVPEHARESKRSYALDFVTGLIHFLLFFIWAFSIDVHTKGLRWFPALLALILLYDVLWVLIYLLKGLDKHPLVTFWTMINALTLLLAGLLYAWLRRQPLVAEQVAFIVVIVASLVDLYEMMTGKESFFKRAIDHLHSSLQKSRART